MPQREPLEGGGPPHSAMTGAEGGCPAGNGPKPLAFLAKTVLASKPVYSQVPFLQGMPMVLGHFRRGSPPLHLSLQSAGDLPPRGAPSAARRAKTEGRLLFHLFYLMVAFLLFPGIEFRDWRTPKIYIYINCPVLPEKGLCALEIRSWN